MERDENDAAGEVDEVRTEPTPPKQRRRSLRILILSGALILGFFLAIPAYQKWHAHRTRQFKKSCVVARDQGEWSRMQLIAEKWTDWDPESDDACVFVAEGYFQHGRLREAAVELGKVSDEYQGAVSALMLRGEILFGDLGLPYEAEANWKRMLSIEPASTHAHQRLIYFYALTLQRGKLVTQIREAIKLRCESPEAYSYLILANSLNFTSAATVISEWSKKLPDDETLEVALAIYTGKNEETSAVGVAEKSPVAPGDQTLIVECLNKYPHNLEVLAYHIDRKIFYDDVASVVELLAASPESALNDARFWRYRGWLLKRTKDYDAALKAFHQSLQFDPFAWRPRFEIATIRRLQGDTDAADSVSDIAQMGKRLEENLYETDGRALTWGLVEEMRDYVIRLDDLTLLAALDDRIRRQGGAALIDEPLIDSNLIGGSQR